MLRPPRTGADGASLLPLLAKGKAAWRSSFLLEHLGDHDSGAPTFCGVRTTTLVYVYYATGEEELYDLRTDPYELSNIVETQPGNGGPELQSMRRLLSDLCSPAPPGLTPPK